MKHLFLYVDGNRRWGIKHQVTERQAYWAAANRMIPLLDFCLDQKIAYVSFYAASVDNVYKRSQENKNLFFTVTAACFEHSLSEFLARGIRVLFIGDLQCLPVFVQKVFAMLAKKTAYCTKLTFSLFFAYGGVEEIVAGARALLYEIKQGNIDAEQALSLCDKSYLKKYMWSKKLPSPDLVIRPAGGHQRLSKGPLFHLEYTEFIFLNDFWPDLDAQILFYSLQAFSQRRRTFGV